MPAKALVGGTSLAGPTAGERWALCDTWMSYMEEFELSNDYFDGIEIAKV